MNHWCRIFQRAAAVRAFEDGRESPQDDGIDIAYHEEDESVTSLRIPLDVAEAIAPAMLACAKEMRAQEEKGTA